MTFLQLLNLLLFQWFGFRIVRSVKARTRRVLSWGIIFVWPTTGWGKPYKPLKPKYHLILRSTYGKEVAERKAISDMVKNIMPDSEVKTPTISDLWDRFNAIKNRFGSTKDYPKLIDLTRYADPAQGRIDWVKEITSLEQQLEEKCKSEPDWTDSQFIHGGVPYHKEMSAYHAYWAWKIDQLNNEKGD